VPAFAERGDSPAAVGLPAAVVPPLLAAGFDVAGVLAAASWDGLVPSGWRCERLLPSARSAVVLACGGGGFERALAGGSWQTRRAQDPVDRFARERLEALAAELAEAGWESRALLYCERRTPAGELDAHAGDFADFISLGRACGLGVVGRLRLLLHPRFGPWLAIRGVLLTALPLEPTPPLAGFDPCDGCPAPCAMVCRGEALAAGPLDLGECFATRTRDPVCRQKCSARRACRLGPEHAYASEVEAYYVRSALLFESGSAPAGPGSGA
jgi:epoxyqueuosine reductase QueG